VLVAWAFEACVQTVDHYTITTFGAEEIFASGVVEIWALVCDDRLEATQICDGEMFVGGVRAGASTSGQASPVVQSGCVGRLNACIGLLRVGRLNACTGLLRVGVLLLLFFLFLSSFSSVGFVVVVVVVVVGVFSAGS
tara:strand:- start:53 stop:466 length:414 start_codon:yes stop_codon:yes gene_type:complete